jgi:DNA-directed RNA polymerase subunit RPC12/RpoP
MEEEKYICRTCGTEFRAIPGEEEPPECPECESDELEKLERATFGDSRRQSKCNPD